MAAQRSFVFRLFMYILVVGLCLEGLVLLLGVSSWSAVLDEGGILEQSQACVLLVSCCGFLRLALYWRPRRVLYNLFALLCFAALVRELGYLEDYWFLTRGAKHAGGLLIGLAYIVFFRRQLTKDAVAVINRPAALLLLLGLVMATFWAQVLGQGVMWKGFYGDEVYLPGKLLAEEGLELVGYLLICFGVVEEWLDCQKMRKNNCSGLLIYQNSNGWRRAA